MVQRIESVSVNFWKLAKVQRKADELNEKQTSVAGKKQDHQDPMHFPHIKMHFGRFICMVKCLEYAVFKFFLLNSAIQE